MSKVYIVKEFNDEDSTNSWRAAGNISHVYAKYEDAVEHCDDLCQYLALDRYRDEWYDSNNMLVLSIEIWSVS